MVGVSIVVRAMRVVFCRTAYTKLRMGLTKIDTRQRREQDSVITDK